MDIKRSNIELSRLNIALPWSRLPWNQASDEIYNLRALLKTDGLVLPTEGPEMLPWSWPGIRSFMLPVFSQSSWAACKPLIFSPLKSPGQLVFVFYDCSVLFFYLKLLLFRTAAALRKNPCLSKRTRRPVLSLWKDRKTHDAWGWVTIPSAWFKSEQPWAFLSEGSWQVPQGMKCWLKWAAGITSGDRALCPAGTGPPLC